MHEKLRNSDEDVCGQVFFIKFCGKPALLLDYVARMLRLGVFDEDFAIAPASEIVFW